MGVKESMRGARANLGEKGREFEGGLKNLGITGSEVKQAFEEVSKEDFELLKLFFKSAPVFALVLLLIIAANSVNNLFRQELTTPCRRETWIGPIRFFCNEIPDKTDRSWLHYLADQDTTLGNIFTAIGATIKNGSSVLVVIHNPIQLESGVESYDMIVINELIIHSTDLADLSLLYDPQNPLSTIVKPGQIVSIFDSPDNPEKFKSTLPNSNVTYGYYYLLLEKAFKFFNFQASLETNDAHFLYDIDRLFTTLATASLLTNQSIKGVDQKPDFSPRLRQLLSADAHLLTEASLTEAPNNEVVVRNYRNYRIPGR